MEFRKQSFVAQALWLVLIVSFAGALLSARWTLAFVSLATLVLSVAPAFVAQRFNLTLPVSFVAAITIFVFSTLFLGEVFDFYERYWWWDMLLHGASAIGLGMTGFLFVFYLFEGDRYAAPPFATAFISVCFAVTVGVIWEIFEFGMDQAFGLNMQKSGLPDTMSDLIIDLIGASIGGASGFFFLKGREMGPGAMLREFVSRNRRFFRKARFRRRRRDESV